MAAAAEAKKRTFTVPASAPRSLPLHREITLYISPERFILEPDVSDTTTASLSVALVFNRQTGEVSSEALGSPTLGQLKSRSDTVQKRIYGIFGIVRLYSGPCLLVISKRSWVGQIEGCNVYKIAMIDILSFATSSQIVGPPTAASNTLPSPTPPPTVESTPTNSNPDTQPTQQPKEKRRLTERQRRAEATFKRVLTALIRAYDFYFSYDFDLTNCLKRRAYLDAAEALGNQQSSSAEASASSSTFVAPANAKPSGQKTPLFLRADDRFFWNKYLQTDLIRLRYYEFVLPVVQGAFTSFLFLWNQHAVEFFLISRRSRFRAGTRYYTRGVDINGNVANYVETEQLVCLQDHWVSYVSTRGSVPLLWEQRGIKLKPEPKFTAPFEAMIEPFQRHFQEQTRLYGRQLVVNLLDHQGVEEALRNAYKSFAEVHLVTLDSATLSYSTTSSGTSTSSSTPPVKHKYVEFDFHYHCRNGNFDQVNVLLEQVRSDLDQIGFTVRLPLPPSQRAAETITPTGIRPVSLVREQQGVARVNCVDCLDRTNLVQSVFARYQLGFLLKSTGLLTPANTNSEHERLFDRLFKQAWADNGDSLSLQYAGTNALKGDFTRTGKRQLRGKINDGMTAVSRYVINNFKDREKQVAIDVLLGNILLNPESAADPMLLVDGDEAEMAEEEGDVDVETTPPGGEMEQPMETASKQDVQPMANTQRDVAVRLSVKAVLQIDSIDSTKADTSISNSDIQPIDKNDSNPSNADTAMSPMPTPVERFVKGWLVLSINQHNKAQRRVLLLTSTTLYHCKYSFRENAAMNYTRMPLTDLAGMQKGFFHTGKAVSFHDVRGGQQRRLYGMCLFLHTEQPKVVLRVASPLDAKTTENSESDESTPVGERKKDESAAKRKHKRRSNSMNGIPSKKKFQRTRVYAPLLAKEAPPEAAREVINEIASAILIQRAALIHGWSNGGNQQTASLIRRAPAMSFYQSSVSVPIPIMDDLTMEQSGSVQAQDESTNSLRRATVDGFFLEERNFGHRASVLSVSNSRLRLSTYRAGTSPPSDGLR